MPLGLTNHPQGWLDLCPWMSLREDVVEEIPTSGRIA